MKTFLLHRTYTHAYAAIVRDKREERGKQVPTMRKKKRAERAPLALVKVRV